MSEYRVRNVLKDHWLADTLGNASQALYEKLLDGSSVLACSDSPHDSVPQWDIAPEGAEPTRSWRIEKGYNQNARVVRLVHLEDAVPRPRIALSKW